VTPLQDQLVTALRFDMRRRGWNQADLAFAANISEKHLSQLMTGKQEGTLTMWQHLFDTCAADGQSRPLPREQRASEPH